MNQIIKAGDFVYIPTYSRKALKVVKNPEGNVRPLCVFINDDTFINFHENGLSSKYHIEPIAFLATPGNKTKIEQFYDCELEYAQKMKAYLPPPLQWVELTGIDEPITQAKSPFSEYSIHKINGDYVCYYHNFVENYSNSKLGKSIDELKDWAENIHYPAKLKKYLIEI